MAIQELSYKSSELRSVLLGALPSSKFNPDRHNDLGAMIFWENSPHRHIDVGAFCWEFS
jgi:hypothetical protein